MRGISFCTPRRTLRGWVSSSSFARERQSHYLPEKLDLGRRSQEGNPRETHSMAEVVRFFRRRVFIVGFLSSITISKSLVTIGCYSVANDGPIFFFHTNENASQYQLISVDISADKPVPTVVIPERKDALLCDVQRVNTDRFVVQYKHNVSVS